MTTSYWVESEGKSVPSGGANQLTVSATKGDNLGNWLSAAYGNIKGFITGCTTPVKIALVSICIIIILFLMKKKRK